MPQENNNGAGAAAPEKKLENPAEVTPTAGGDGSDEGGDAATGGDDETVTVKKSDFDKLSKERKDFEEGLKIANIKLKGKNKAIAPEPADSKEPVTKGDLYKSNEKAAIKQATTINDSDSPEIKAIKSDLESHWDDIKVHYSGASGRDSAEAILEDIFDAHAVWKRRNASKKDEKGEDNKDVKADLGIDRKISGSSHNPKPVRKHILPKFGSPREWYNKDK